MRFADSDNPSWRHQEAISMSVTGIDKNLERWKYSAFAYEDGILIARQPTNNNEHKASFYSFMRLPCMDATDRHLLAAELSAALLSLHRDDHDTLRTIYSLASTKDGRLVRIVSIDRTSDTCGAVDSKLDPMAGPVENFSFSDLSLPTYTKESP